MVKTTLNPKHSDGELDTELLMFFSYFTDKNYPIIEVGVYKGDSAKFLYEQAQHQSRDLILIDDYGFIQNRTGRFDFYKGTVLPKLKLINKDLTGLKTNIIDSRDFNWGKNPSSYIHIDGGPDYEDLENFFENSPSRSIAVLDDYLHTPHKIEQSITRIQSGYMYPICMGQKKIWVCQDKSFHAEIVNTNFDQLDYWLYLKDKYRYQMKNNFFGNKVHKFYSAESKQYHNEMNNYG